MVKLDFIQMRRIQLEILEYVDVFCRENDINYSLSGGTLLGAVRHKGFIPWDDDIDIMMLRDDYNKFLASFSSEKYKVYTNENDRNYNFPFAKISDETTYLKEDANNSFDIGINIDLFPIDNLPDDYEESARFYSEIGFFKRMFEIKTRRISKDRSLIKSLAIILVQILAYGFSYKGLAKKISRKSQKYNSVRTNFVGCIVWGYGIKERGKRSAYDKFIEMNFENHMFMVMSDYEYYLKGLYGDYMQLPPKGKRVAKHSFEAYIKNSTENSSL